MRLLASVASAFFISLAACASSATNTASTQQARGALSAMPQTPAIQRLATQTPASLVGTWDVIQRSYGGLGQTLLFSADGNVGLVFGAMVDMKYKVEGDKVTVYGDDPGNKFSVTSKLTLIGDTAIVSFGELSPLPPRRMVRLPTSGPTSALVGNWQYMHYTGVPGYEEYTEDGSLRLRVPALVQRGIYSVEGNKVSIRILTPARENLDAEFGIKGDTLSMRMRGQKHLFLRARPLIPHDVQQPPKPSGVSR